MGISASFLRINYTIVPSICSCEVEFEWQEHYQQVRFQKNIISRQTGALNCKTLIIMPDIPSLGKPRQAMLGFLKYFSLTLSEGQSYRNLKIFHSILLVYKSIHNSGGKNLAIWHHKKLIYLFYLLTCYNSGLILAFNTIK